MQRRGVGGGDQKAAQEPIVDQKAAREPMVDLADNRLSRCLPADNRPSRRLPADNVKFICARKQENTEHTYGTIRPDLAQKQDTLEQKYKPHLGPRDPKYKSI